MKLSKNRNLLTADVLTLFLEYEKRLNEPMTARHIEQYVERLARSGVDTFLVNPNFQRAWYPSKRVPAILEGYVRGDRDYFRGHWHEPNYNYGPLSADHLDHSVLFYNQFLDLIEQGVDWLEEAAKACRVHGIAPWATIRMNDIHSMVDPNPWFKHPIFETDKFLLRNYSMYPSDAEPFNRTRAKLNYEFAEARAYMFEQIEDVVMNYDYEGLELDWLRNPACCEPGASQAAIDTMTDWMADIRALTERKSRMTGRPYALGLRIPVNVAAMRNIGLDVPAMIARDLVDFVNPSNFLQAAWDVPYDQFRQAFGPDVAIYGTVEGIANFFPVYSTLLKQEYFERFTSMSPEMLYANAAGKLVMGVDGIETYNFYVPEEIILPGFDSEYSALENVHQLDQLRGKPKHYSFSVYHHGYAFPPFEMTEQLPVILEKGWRRAFRISMCAEPADAAANLQLTIQIIVRKQPILPPLAVSFNGTGLTYEATMTDKLLFPAGPIDAHVDRHIAFNYAFDVSHIRDGWNEVVVYVEKHYEGSQEYPQVVIACIELAVKERSM